MGSSAPARFHGDERAQGRGIGLELLKFVFVLTRRLAGDFGCVGVLVDAKPGAVELYRRYGFEDIELVAGRSGGRPEPTPLFLELGAIPEAPAE